MGITIMMDRDTPTKSWSFVRGRWTLGTAHSLVWFSHELEEVEKEGTDQRRGEITEIMNTLYQGGWILDFLLQENRKVMGVKSETCKSKLVIVNKYSILCIYILKDGGIKHI